METLEHDILLLMLHLSRMHDRGRILELFVEALAASRPGITARLLGAGEACAGEVLEVATPDGVFGRVCVDGPLTDEARAIYRNAGRMLAVVLENVTRAARLASENERLDAAVAARTAELQGALARSEDLYQHAPCGYHALDPEGRFLQINETELGWLGYARAEVVGRLRLADLVRPEERPAVAELLARLREQEPPRDVELELVRKDGTGLPVLMSTTAVRDGAGHLTSSRGTLYDLSERKAADRALEESQARLRQSQKLEALGRLAGGVAHDFNNLLTIILSCAEELQEELEEGPLRQEAAEIADAGARAAQLTRQLLSFSRRQATQPAVLDLGEVVAGMEKMLRRLIGEDLELTVVRAPGLSKVHADPAQLEQVVLNLVVNARDALTAGGRIRIEVGNLDLDAEQAARLEVAPGRLVALTVADTGCGMTPDVRARVFEPFFTTKPEGRGTGLGLATVYGIVKQAGGEIRVESTPGHGTRFEVFLPAVAQAGVAAAAPAGGDALEPGREVLLLVEDDERVRAVTAAALRRAGYTVLEATDGESALEVAGAAGRIDVLVTDVVMPRLGGPDLAARLRAGRARLGVVFVSGYAGQRHAAELGGGATVLDKPHTAAMLTRAVRAEVARVERANAAALPPASRVAG